MCCPLSGMFDPDVIISDEVGGNVSEVVGKKSKSDRFAQSDLREKSLSAKVVCPRITRVVSSTVFCQAIFEERHIRERLSGK